MMAAAVLAVLSAGGVARADAIAPGGAITGVVITGDTSIYNIFGHDDPGVGVDSPAFLVTFAAGAGNVFDVTARGEIGCCGGAINQGPDGAAGPTNITGANGLSSLSGNGQLPIVGVFTTETDPFGSPPPAALTFDAHNPASIAPLLNQVFYIGDGLTGFGDANGALLNFVAPTDATRLYIGLIDGYAFTGPTGWYHDNPGSFTVAVHLASGAPEPAAWALMILGFAAAGGALRSRRRRAVAA